MSQCHLAIVTDVTLADWIGGGTLVNAYLADCARQLGWHVSFIRINSQVDEWKYFPHADVDAYFVANVPHMPVAYMLDLVNGGKRYVMFRHDISSICYAPDAAQQPAAKLVRFLFENSAANFFISNLQLSYYQRVCEVPRAVVIPPPLDLSRFSDEKNPERAGHLYLGEIASVRGIEESLHQMKAAGDDGVLAFYGQVTTPNLDDMLRMHGAQVFLPVDHLDVPALLNRYRHFYYHPRIVDAFCLKVLEAELCGMTLHVNRNHIGRYYYSDSAQEIATFMRSSSPAMILQVLQDVGRRIQT